MRINIVVPSIKRNKYSGGLFGLMIYADGLAKRGHEVNVVPMLPSPVPDWFNGDYDYVTDSSSVRTRHFLGSCSSGVGGAHRLIGKANIERSAKSSVYNVINSFLVSLDPRLLSFELRRTVSLLYLSGVMPDADVTIATSFETALPVALYGTGRKHYFLQHFESYFKEEFSNPGLAEKDALASYFLGLNMIANSSWLKSKVEGHVPGANVELCLNAIDHNVFRSDGPAERNRSEREVVVISYGGRDAVWKGFAEMAEAVKITREALSGYHVRWQVYGDALLPPDNEVATYEALGFLRTSDLAKAYRSSDVLLSASWYESFPAFALEAMACGLPVVTTAPGTEDYAIHGETAEVVEPRSPEKIASGLIKLITDTQYRSRIAKSGLKKSRELTWQRSVERMERIING